MAYKRLDITESILSLIKIVLGLIIPKHKLNLLKSILNALGLIFKIM